MKSILFFTAFLISTTISSFAQDATALNKKHFNLDDGIAIKGYDPVAYFIANKAVKGSKDLAVYHQGATYYFSSAGNKELFKANPSKYLPEYGGWCAYAMGAKGEKVSIDPETYKIVGGKLYLFYNKFFNNTLKDWNKDEANLKKNADANWIKIFH
ncbi:YHS domain-containing (seleno)protein [Ferruginibacter sp. SUN106]|uniref:YHS domain-containing (seleno)protein n=1 Tax=Ferruginibacter sp. SUN106 TaxID=2978348 RepID=UPI003D3658E5